MPISDDGLKHLAHLRNLRTLLLDDCRVTAKGLAHLGTLPELSTLQFSGAPIDDDVVALLRGTDFPRLLGFDPNDKKKLSKEAREEKREVRKAREERSYLRLDPLSFWGIWEAIHPMRSNWRIGDVQVDATDAKASCSSHAVATHW